MATSVAAGGELLDLPWRPSLSDGTVGLVEPGSITYPLCRECVDEWVLVEEEEIATALRLVMREHCVMVEGAGAVSVAAYLRTRERWQGKNVVCVVSGARIGLESLAGVLRGAPPA
jgi:threonine dehydratase